MSVLFWLLVIGVVVTVAVWFVVTVAVWSTQRQRKAAAEQQRQAAAQHRAWQLSRWPKGTMLDSRIASIDGIFRRWPHRTKRSSRKSGNSTTYFMTDYESRCNRSQRLCISREIPKASPST